MGKIYLEIKNKIETIACYAAILYRAFGNKAGAENAVKVGSRNLGKR